MTLQPNQIEGLRDFIARLDERLNQKKAANITMTAVSRAWLQTVLDDTLYDRDHPNSDLATARRLLAEAEERADQAEADAASMRDLLQEVVFSVPSGTALRSRLAQKLGEPNPGAPLVRERDDAQRDARQLAEALEIEHAARLQAEADAAALRAKLAELIADDNESLCNCGVLLPLFERNVRDIKALLAADHLGAALLTELEAARTVIAIARRGFGIAVDVLKAEAFDPVALTHAIERYDAARSQAAESEG